MSTIGYTSWAVDLADVGAVYPFQGWEVTMTVVGVIFWLGWHVMQHKREQEHLEKARHLKDVKKVEESIDRY